MTRALYLQDSYLKACSAKVTLVLEGNGIALDQTVFYPTGGGQPCDTGRLIRGGEEFPVVSVAKAGGEIIHRTAKAGLQAGDEVQCAIDWERRYRLMRMHTAGHVLSAIMYKEAGILITGNQLGVDKTRFDFSMENFDRAAFELLVDEANRQIARNLPVEISFLPRDEAMKIEGAVKLASALPPEIKELRMVRIGDLDYQADGGTHVRNTGEIGKIVFLSAENKGRSNRRITYGLEP
ncbi:MAG: alanyl-tRNA editing protein AlaXM [Candidatus Micrarchaeota archaeon]|nr:alanyl-tRNA editing protein AlaXM [Candidatus Micrarchaeota archaeon]